jgi:hypothetical protein
MQIEQITINGVSFNRTDSEKCWRLIHDGNLVVSLEEGVGVLSTQLNIFLAKSKEACLAEIYKLNLEYYPSEEE